MNKSTGKWELSIFTNEWAFFSHHFCKPWTRFAHLRAKVFVQIAVGDRYKSIFLMGFLFRKVPTLLEYYSYILQFSTLICGPPSEFHEFKAFIEGYKQVSVNSWFLSLLLILRLFYTFLFILCFSWIVVICKNLCTILKQFFYKVLRIMETLNMYLGDLTVYVSLQKPRFSSLFGGNGFSNSKSVPNDMK